MRLKIAMLFVISSALYYARAQCFNDIDLGVDTVLCSNQSYTLNLGASYDSYLWHDNFTGFSFFVDDPGTYYCTVTQASGNNLVQNGDFEAGNTQFTTDYTFYPIADVFGPQASYGIINNPNTWFNPFNPCVDHTSGSGNMMVLDGSAFNGGNDAIWCQSIPVQANTNYSFSYWIQSVTASPILANIQIRINGVVVDTELAPLGACIWEQRSVNWTSTNTGNVDICLYDLELAGNGNDFALDDISFLEICEYSDTLEVTYLAQDTTFNLIEICPGDSVLIGSNWESEIGVYYELISGTLCDEILASNLTWRPIDTIRLSQQICPGDSFFLQNAWQRLPGTYYDIVNGFPCDEIVETELTWIAVDTSFVQEEICVGDSIFLAGAWQYMAGEYVEFVPGLSCGEYLQTNLVLNDYPIADAGNDRTVAYEQIINLSAAGPIAGVEYIWTSSNNFIDTSKTISIEVVSSVSTYYLSVTEGTCTSFDTLTVFGIPLELAIVVPNAFSPNNDGVNDYFRIINHEKFEYIKMKIYNRWGELVYVDEGLNPMWNGEFKKDKMVSLGTYAFYIEAQAFGEVPLMQSSGMLTLIK